jgi:dihydropyrimidinase
VIWDAEATRTVRAADQFTNADYSIYEGWTITVWPTTTIRRGEVIFESGESWTRPAAGAGFCLPPRSPCDHRPAARHATLERRSRSR